MLETFGADDAAEKFGDMAAEILQYAKDLQVAGKKYCWGEKLSNLIQQGEHVITV